MGGNQENDGLGEQHVPQHSDQSVTELRSLSRDRGPSPLLNRERFDTDSIASGSYFSTLEVPQNFSFVQNFQKANASFLPGLQSRSHDRSLSSSMSGHQLPDVLPYGSIHDIPSCSSRSWQGQTSGGDMVGSLTRPRRSRTRSYINDNSLKRQKYLENRRKITTSPPVLIGKRRSVSDDEDEGISLQPVRKVFVNEDKMAARFDGLSLSHSFRSPAAEARRIMADIDSRLMDSDDEDDEEGSRPIVTSGRRLQMSDSLKSALRQSPTEVLPERIAKKIANPCTAMILWKPPDHDKDLEMKSDDTSGNDSQMEGSDRDTCVERPLFSGSTDWSNVDDPDENMDL